MKRTIMWLILALVLLAAGGSTPVLADGGGDPPLCYPKSCPNG